MDFADDVSGVPQTAPDQAGVTDETTPENVQALQKRIAKTIRADKEFHEPAFKRMRKSMRVALRGRDDDWSEKNYAANISGRHVKQKTAALYAKNPKAVARRRDTLDFTVWDEDVQSLELAFKTVQTATQMATPQPQATNVIDHATGQPLVHQAEPDLPPGFEQANALIADFQQGMIRRQQIKRIGRTLEILFAQALREQTPLDFKAAMKQLVRRACTTGVGYIEAGFQREMGSPPGTSEKLADAQARIAHLQSLAKQAADGEIDPEDAEMAELQASTAALQAEPEVVVREGLVFDFPQSTRVIPDKLCQSLVGFIGSRHLTVEYLFTKAEVQETFNIDLGQNYTSYNVDGSSTKDSNRDAARAASDDERIKGDLACVWKHYDKPSGLVYYLCDGYDGFLRDPAAPDVFVEEFWPVYALTFNAVESEDELFPPSDVELLLPMQNEHNRSRQGKREHRQAARPRYAAPRGVLDDDDKKALEAAIPHSVTEVGVDPGTDMKGVIQPIPTAGVDPNLYDTNEIYSDIQIVVGSQASQMGAVAKSTATEAAIASGSSSIGDSSSVDDLDNFLSRVSRAAGQILLKEMSPEQVQRIVGPGALWPEMSLADIADELFLEVEAGSTGKPNQAQEVQNWEKMLPFLIQMPGIKPEWLARETLRRLDDRMDLTDALVENIPAIIAQNRMSQPAPGDPQADPAAQGHQGADNGPRAPGGPSGTGPAFGSNQV